MCHDTSRADHAISFVFVVHGEYTAVDQVADFSGLVGKERVIARPEATASRSGSNRYYAV